MGNFIHSSSDWPQTDLQWLLIEKERNVVKYVIDKIIILNDKFASIINNISQMKDDFSDWKMKTPKHKANFVHKNAIEDSKGFC